MSDSIYTPQPGEFYTYILWNPFKKTSEFPNGLPFYVGKGTGRRAFRHLQNVAEEQRNNPHKFNTVVQIKNAGSLPGVTCAWTGSDEDYAFRVERLLIALWGRSCDGGLLTNLQSGGESGRAHSLSTREKMSAARKGKQGTPCSPETKELIRRITTGKRPSSETRAKMSQAQKGNKRAKGYKHTAEARARISYASSHPSDETRRKVSEGVKAWWAKRREQR